MAEVKTEPVKAVTMIESANASANSLKAENERMERNIAELKELQTFDILGGKSTGKAQEAPIAEINPREYAKLALQGKIPLKT